MQISVLVPLLNERAILEEQLTKLEETRKQSKAPHSIEVIACDGGSTDGSLDILSRIEEQGLLDLRVFKGKLKEPSIAGTFSLGLSEVRGKFILLLPLDCSLDSNSFDELLDLCNKPNANRTWGASLKNYDKESLPLQFSLWVQNSIRSKLFTNFLWTNAFFLSRELLDAVKWPSEVFLDDLVLCDRLKRLPKAEFHLLSSRITVDSRNYQKHFCLTKMLSNTLIVLLYRSRVFSPKSLKAVYKYF